MNNRRRLLRTAAIALCAMPSIVTVARASRTSVARGHVLGLVELEAIGRLIASATRLDDVPHVLAQVSGVDDLTVDHEPGRCRLTLTKPVPAVRLCQAFGWARAYGVASDVHQTSWTILLSGGDLADSFGPRIWTTTPRLGRWAIDVALTHRPQGKLPELSAGASPAYDLSTHLAETTSIEIRAVDKNRDA